MRPVVRSIATLLAAVGVATCSDVLTGPAHAPEATTVASRGSISLTPDFSVAATAASSRLANFGISYDHVRVVLVRTAGDTVADTSLVFAPGLPDVTLDLSVALHAVDEIFAASIDFANSTDVVFHGQGMVRAHAADRPSSIAQPIAVDYVGPGSSATRIVISPHAASIMSSTTEAFSVAAFDANGAPISPGPVLWTTSDPSIATISDETLHPTGKRGVVTISAITPTSLTDSASVTVSLPATTISIASGDAQTGRVATALSAPVIVRVTSADGVGVTGVPVNFVGPAGGAANPGSTTTDANGTATTTLTLATAAGPQSFGAATSEFVVAIHATATPGNAATITVASGGGQSATVRGAIGQPLVARVVDAFGNLVPGATVSWSRVGSGTLATATSVTGPDGLASVTYVVGSVVGRETITAATAGVSATASFGVTVLPALPTVLVWNVQPSQVVAGSVMSPAPQVAFVDADGAAVDVGSTVTIALAGGTPSQTLSGTLTQAAVHGVATFANLSLNGAGTGYTLSPGTPGPVSGTISHAFNVVAATAAVSSIAGITLSTAPQATDSNNVAFTVAPAIQLIDASSHAVALANVVVTMTAVAPSGGTPNSAPALLVGTATAITATTDANGIATFSGARAVGFAQDYALKFSATPAAQTITRTSSDIHLVAGPANQLAATAGNNLVAYLGTALTTGQRTQLRDTLGQTTTYPATAITYAVSGTGAGATPAGATTNGSGYVDATWMLGSTEGSAVLTASATLGGVVRTTTFNATASDIHGIALVATPTTATNGQVLSPQPTIQLNDGTTSHNALRRSGVVITATVGTANFTLSGTATATTDANGLATFNNLGILTTQGGLTGRITFAVTSGTTQTISSVTTDVLVNAGSATTIERSGNLILNTVVGTPLSSYPSVRLLDVGGSPVPNSSGVSVSYSVVSGSCTTSAVLSTTNAQGIASLSSSTLNLPSVAGSCIVRATSASLTGSPIDFDVVVGPSSSVYTWLGASSSDITVSSNWSGPSSTPGTGNDIFVPKSVPNYPNVTANSGTTLRAATLEGGAGLTVSANVLTLTGNVAGGTGSTVSILSGATILFQGGTTTLGNLTVNSGTATFSHDATISGVLSALNSAVVNNTSGSGRTLTVSGSLTSSSGSTLSGLNTVKFTGSTFPVYGNTTSTGAPAVTQISANMSVPNGVSTTVARDLTISDAALSVNGNGTSLTVGGNLDVTGAGASASGELIMTSGTPTVVVVGTATFRGKTQQGQGLTAGTLELRGNFAQQERTSGANGEFEPGGAPFLVKFTGGNGGQTVSFAGPGTGPGTGSYFADVTVTNQSGVTQATNAYVNGGTMTVIGDPNDLGAPAMWVTGPGNNNLFITGGSALMVHQSGLFTVTSGGALDVSGTCTMYQTTSVVGNVVGATCVVNPGQTMGSIDNLFRTRVVGFRR